MQHSPLGIALVPVWADLPIAYSGLLEDGSIIQGLWDAVARMEGFPVGIFGKEHPPPLLAPLARGLDPQDPSAAGRRPA